MTVALTELQAAWNKLRQREEEDLKVSLQALFAFLDENGVQKATTIFEGSGDSGEVNFSSFQMKDGRKLIGETSSHYYVPQDEHEDRVPSDSLFIVDLNSLFLVDQKMVHSKWNPATEAWDPIEQVETRPLHTFVVRVASQLLASEHSGWEINEGSFGRIEFDAESGVTIDFNEYIMSTNNYVTKIRRW